MNRLPLVLHLSTLWGRKRETFLGSASPPLHFCQMKCLTSAILQHMLDVNIMSLCLALMKKSYWKKVNKNVLVSCMSLLFSCSQFLFSFQWNKCCSSKKSKDTLWLLAIVQQAGNVCRLQHRHLQCRVPPSPMLPPLQPQQEARMAMQNSFGTSSGCPRRH